MKKIINTQRTDDANVFGEIIREYAFKEPYGCYSCFDLKDEFTEVNQSYDIVGRLQVALGIHVLHEYEKGCFAEYRNRASYYSNGSIHIGWFWDGDGTLAIIEGDRCAVNFDCKKDYTWEWVRQ